MLAVSILVFSCSYLWHKMLICLEKIPYKPIWPLCFTNVILPFLLVTHKLLHTTETCTVVIKRRAEKLYFRWNEICRILISYGNEMEGKWTMISRSILRLSCLMHGNIFIFSFIELPPGQGLYLVVATVVSRISLVLHYFFQKCFFCIYYSLRTVTDSRDKETAIKSSGICGKWQVKR